MGALNAALERIEAEAPCGCRSPGMHCAWDLETDLAAPPGVACPLHEGDPPAARDAADPREAGDPPDIWLG